jgi:hypothetical protein
MRITATAASAAGDAEGEGVEVGVVDGSGAVEGASEGAPDGALDGLLAGLPDGALVAPADPDGLADGPVPQAPMSMANSTTTREADFFMSA